MYCMWLDDTNVYAGDKIMKGPAELGTGVNYQTS